MRSLLINLGVFLLITGLTSSILRAQEIKSPKDFFGFQTGDDHKYFDYEQLISYLQLLENTNEKIKLVEIGRSPNDKPMYVLLISSAENQTKLYVNANDLWNLQAIVQCIAAKNQQLIFKHEIL